MKLILLILLFNIYMSEHPNIRINFIECFSSLYLNEKEWKKMIETFFSAMQTKPLTKKLYDRMLYFLNKGYSIEIATNDDSRVIYPKIRYITFNRVMIIIPSINYFINVESIENKNNIKKNIASTFLRCEPFILPITFNELMPYKNSIYYTPQTYFIMFVHELIHAIRFFEKIHLDTQEEEDATIYGIVGKTLILDGNHITENTIRREWNKPPRISHNSEDIFICGVQHTYKNSKNFSKESFFYL